MDINKIVDEIYDRTLDVIARTRIEQIKKYIEVYEELKKEALDGKE
jgi:hypothetical protein